MSRASSDDDDATRESEDTDESVYTQEGATPDARGRRPRLPRKAKADGVPKEGSAAGRSQRKTPKKGKRTVPSKVPPEATAPELSVEETEAADEAT
jgi:hypothetical protein